MVQLLDRIFESGSIRQAALSKGMSYRTAWIMVQEVEKIVGSWPARWDTARAQGFGLTGDRTFADVIRGYLAERSDAQAGRRA